MSGLNEIGDTMGKGTMRMDLDVRNIATARIHTTF